MSKALTFIKDKKSMMKKIFIGLGIICCSLFGYFVAIEQKYNNHENYCYSPSYIFFALSPCILSLTFGSVFLYIRKVVKQTSKNKENQNTFEQ